METRTTCTIARKIFSILRRFYQSKSRLLMFKKACARGCQKEVPQKVVVLPPLARLALKRLQIGRHAAYRNKHCSVTIF